MLKWVEENPAAQLLTLDWKNAKQAVINGKNVVRVPTLNISTGVTIPGMNSREPLSIGGNGTDKKNSTAPPKNSPASPHYYERHPPEVFFVQNGPGEKVRAALLNFVPTDPNTEFGKDGIWTGKLYSWNLQGDTLWVRELVKSKLKDRYGLTQPAAAEAKTELKATSQNKTANADSKVSCCFFEWLATKLGNFVGWVGDLLGLPLLMP